MQLTDAHLVLLSAASQRDDGLLPRPKKLAGAALTRTAEALVRAGLVESMTVRSDQPHWRQDEDGTRERRKRMVTTQLAGTVDRVVLQMDRVEIIPKVEPDGPRDAAPRCAVACGPSAET